MLFAGEGAVQRAVTPALWLLRALPHPSGFLEGWSRRDGSDALHRREPSRATLATDRAEGEHVRSFQLMAKRIKKAPGLAKILVHKPGPLIDTPDEIPDYADVFRRGVLEIGKLLQGVKAKPGG